MEKPDDKFCCQNEKCPLYGRRAMNNLRFQGWSGKGKIIRMIFCRECEKLFSERKGTLLSGRHLTAKQVINVLTHLYVGNGIRQTAILTDVGKDTVCRIARIAGQHARLLHDELVAFSPSDAGDSIRRDVEFCVPQG